MDDYLTHWFPTYVIIRIDNSFADSDLYTLLNTQLNQASFNSTSLSVAARSKTVSFFTIDHCIDYLFLNKATIVAESDYPMTPLTHPELFV